MVVFGHVRNGVIVLDDPIELEEGLAVSIEIIDKPTETKPTTLLDRLKTVVGTAQGLPPDASSNVDHYLYGHSKS
jgi:hypothetical protein